MHPLFLPLNLQPEKLVAPTCNPKSFFGVHGPQRNVGSLAQFQFNARSADHGLSRTHGLTPYLKFSRLPLRGQALLSPPLAGGVAPWQSQLGYDERQLNESKI